MLQVAWKRTYVLKRAQQTRLHLLQKTSLDQMQSKSIIPQSLSGVSKRNELQTQNLYVVVMLLNMKVFSIAKRQSL